jgi:hypothetical protein
VRAEGVLLLCSHALAVLRYIMLATGIISPLTICCALLAEWRKFAERYSWLLAEGVQAAVQMWPPACCAMVVFGNIGAPKRRVDVIHDILNVFD